MREDVVVTTRDGIWVRRGGLRTPGQRLSQPEAPFRLRDLSFHLATHSHLKLAHYLQYNLGLRVRLARPGVVMCCPQAWVANFPPLSASWCSLFLAFHRVWQQGESTLTEPVQGWKLFHESFKIHGVPTAIISINCSWKRKELCYRESTSAWDCVSPLHALGRELWKRAPG